MSNDVEMFMSSPALLDMIVMGMLKRLRNHKQQFIFTFCILDGHPQKLAADVLGIHETNVAREIRRIRVQLVPYTKGYNIGSKYVKKSEKPDTITEYGTTRPTQHAN